MTTDLLIDDHAEVDALLRDLPSAFERGEAREVFHKLDYLWARLAVHIRAEHLHLFPALLAASAAGQVEGASPEEVGGTVERLREDHDFFMRELAGAVNAARELASQESASPDATPDRRRLLEIGDSVRAVAERLAEHNRVEERQVYLWPEALLGASRLDALRAGMRREIENLPPRFSGDAAPRRPHPRDGKTRRRITAYDRDEEGHWRAVLDCGHAQHVRHDPPLVTREWVLTERGRASRLGLELDCKLCDGEPPDEGARGN